LEKRGLWQLRIDSYLKHSSPDSILPCLGAGCEASFTDRIIWEKHLRNNQHHFYYDFGARSRGPFEFCEKLCENTPPDIKAALMARCERVDQRDRELEALSQKLRNDWCAGSNDWTKEKNRSFEETCKAQLRGFYVD
jgi:hypothetical protein